MASASFGVLNGDLPKDFKFKKNVWTHQIETHEVESITTFQQEKKIGNYKIIEGAVNDWVQKFHKERRFDAKNNPYIFKTIQAIPIEIPFIIINKKYVQTEHHTDMRILLQNLNLTVPSKLSFHYIAMNLQKINVDYPKQWYDDINPNRPHFSRGKIYGDDIVKDEVIGGQKFKDFLRTDIGIEGNVDDNNVKIRITNHGYFQIPSNVNDVSPPDQYEFMKFFMKIMQFYAAIGKIAPKPKIK